ncbi:hypothetical protein HYH03_010057 [Edaphochlamys debaryana]|uniref:Uncharacterized protein n=1 Tax=Edaphochlamys debaryana TaxID=47281 RepID=A0A835Y616_9CHLO|nr:hypothetical protein HYH03_010057 [Edaphochlamys debaryana]|eukprot:KAG2491689.1 hypothetical protein HYH03_010057 [Edaphochlamys debaryana]
MGIASGLSTSARACAAEVALPEAAPSSSLAPALHLDGSRNADPGEPRYTAPYWVPPSVRDQHRLPNVLFTDPWPASDEPAQRRAHAALCLQALRRANRPLTTPEVHAAVNEDIEASGPGAEGVPPPLATLAYTKHLLEHMRRTRLLYGKKNNDSALSSGHPDHPRLYLPLPYQAARRGSAEQVAQEDAAAKDKAVQRALKRLRNGKPPYPIHRRRARFSIWQHELAQEALQRAS